MDLQVIYSQFSGQIYSFAPRVVWAVFALVFGWWFIGIFTSFLFKHMAKLEDTLETFLKSFIKTGLKILLIITVVSMLGVEMTSFIAVLGAAAFAVGMALQGSLGNFAGGVLILFFRPFHVGDFIEAQGHKGKVHAIHIFNTIIKTGDNRTIIIPNGPISNGSITNYSTEKKRRVDITFGIGYSDDEKKAIKIIEALIADDERIIKDPEPFVRVTNLGDSSVDITMRAWCERDDYWSIYNDFLTSVKLNFDKNGINIPYPTRDVHVYKH